MKSKIIIGDVHGQLDALKKLLAKIPSEFLAKDICFSGDLIDRGPHSREVLELVKNQGFDMCRGNHEEFMVTNEDMWKRPRNGGWHTFRQYEDDMPTFREHQKWVRTLPYYLEYKDIVNHAGKHLVVSHSSIQKVWEHRDAEDERKEEFIQGVLWDRNKSAQDIPEVYNVFGHTPQKLTPTIKESWACIDGGGFATWRPKQGRLWALQFPEMIVYEVKTENKYYEDYLDADGYQR